MSNTSEYLKGIVLNLPEGPGIYQYLNKEGVIIYVEQAATATRASVRSWHRRL